MLHHNEGDLLKSDCTTILHQANCHSTMGAGVAKSIAKIYPEAELVDSNSDYSPEDKFGKFTYAVTESGVTVANLYGQYNTGIGLQTDYKMMNSALNYFLYSAKAGLGNNVNLNKVGVPYGMGCGLAGGDWEIVKDMLERASLKHQVDIYVYKL